MASSSLSIFTYLHYPAYLRDWIQSQPRNGHGVMRAMAEFLNVHPTLISQILKGKKDLSAEHADALCAFMRLSELESDYFLLIVQYGKAGTQALKQRLLKKIEKEQDRSKSISQRLNVEDVFSDEAKNKFYSSWIYSGVRNLSALPSMNSSQQVAEHLRLPRELVQEVVEFLVSHKLCVLTDKGLSYGPQRTHVGADSVWALQHHRNWRSQAEQKMSLKSTQDLFFTFPMSLSKKDAESIRKLLPQWIEEIHKIVGPSPSETVRCLNLDFFEY